LGAAAPAAEDLLAKGGGMPQISLKKYFLGILDRLNPRNPSTSILWSSMTPCQLCPVEVKQQEIRGEPVFKMAIILPLANLLIKLKN
jgi:hypothetical protein